ncbi:MAG: hypothetical protein KFF73_04290 [Cyclobacteriaceae bacterium]|nr:hypothetical protein [Cyclobacteriaceae bacterium]
MRPWRSITVIFILFPIFQHSLFSQSAILENNPPSITWYQINTPHFRVIFDRNFEKGAQLLANRMEQLYVPGSRSLDQETKKISLILQNHHVIPNGFVSQTPRRSEFFTMPTQDYNFSGSINWLDLLAVHEYRHVVQFDKSITGFNKFLHLVFGYQTSSSMAHIAVPEWFWEGDAVNMETALTRSGRGRIPNFSLLMRTNTLTRGPFNYYRQYLRSFRYNIQDHYVTGHYLTAYFRRKYGVEVISKITEETWRWPFLPFRFSSMLKKHTGTYLVPGYNHMMNELDSIWRHQLRDRKFNEFRRINFRNSGRYTDYLYPHYTNDGKIVALKQGIGDIATFVEFSPEGSERKLFVPGFMNESGMISLIDDKIVWNEFEFDPRFRKKSYSGIRSYELEAGKHSILTRKGRYGSAALSPDGSRIVTVETTENGSHALTILNARLGWVIEKIPNPENDFYVNPRWSENGEFMVTVRQDALGKTIMVYHMETGEKFDLWPSGPENIGYPVMFKSFILYNSPYDGIDNIYAYDLIAGRRFRVTNSKFGAYNPQVSWNGQKMLYNDFSQFGHDVVEIDFNPNVWTPVEEISINKEGYIDPIVDQEGNPELLTEMKDTVEYPVNRYQVSGNMINPFSWGPVITSTDLDFFIGLTSQDILSTTRLNLGYEFNANEKNGRWVGSLSYQGIFPVINLNGYIGDRSATERFIFMGEDGHVDVDTTADISWKEKGFELGLQIPLILTRSKYLENLDVGLNYNYTRVTDYDFLVRYPDMQGNGDLYYNSYYLSYRRNMKRSRRDLYGKFGQNIFIQYDHTPYGGDYLGGLFAGELRLIFPGLFRHHSFQLRSSYLNQNLTHGNNTYLFRSPVLFTRGYSYMFFEHYLNNSVNYALPLLYPDIHVGPFLNLQRIYTNLFFDHGTRMTENDRDYFRSVGAEVSFDFNLMRFLTRFNVGFRYSYAMDNDPAQQHNFQLLIGNFGF